MATASDSLLNLAAAASAKSGKAGGAVLSVTKLALPRLLAPALLEEPDRFLDFVGLEKEVLCAKEFLRSFVRTLGCWRRKPFVGGCCCCTDSPDEVPGRDLEEEPKKAKALWVAEADFGIILSIKRGGRV